MNDEAFTLTPLDIRKQEFRKTLRGYDTFGVEDFRIRVADALERAIRDRQVLEERVAALTEQLRVFRDRERAMNEALVAAQQLRQDTRAAAEREGQVIVREAEAAAKRLLDEARIAESAVQSKMAETERQYQQYMGGFRALLERQLAELRAVLDQADPAAAPEALVASRVLDDTVKGDVVTHDDVSHFGSPFVGVVSSPRGRRWSW